MVSVTVSAMMSAMLSATVSAMVSDCGGLPLSASVVWHCELNYTLDIIWYNDYMIFYFDAGSSST